LLRRGTFWVRALFDRGRLDRELREKMESHLEMLAEEVGDHAARRQFGNPTLSGETSRELWGWRSTTSPRFPVSPAHLAP